MGWREALPSGWQAAGNMACEANLDLRHAALGIQPTQRMGAAPQSCTTHWWLACRTCLRGQTFFSLGLRFLYAFIPLVGGLLGQRAVWRQLVLSCRLLAHRPSKEAVPPTRHPPPATRLPTHCSQTMWVLGGTWLLLGTVAEVTLLYVLDQL